MTPPPSHLASAFGLRWRADVPLDGFDQLSETDATAGEILVRRVDAFAAREPVRHVNRGTLFRDGLALAATNEAAFEMADGCRIDYRPGPGWRGTMPASFYSTAVALTLAWRGLVPFHACAVEIAGRAVLLAGPSGAGKSSLTAGLVGRGARFVADDLTVLHAPADGPATVYRGRPTMRQHADTAALVEATERSPIAGDPRGKWAVRPARRSEATALPLGGVLLLGDVPTSATVPTRAAQLGHHLFRPKWLAALPGRAERSRAVLMVAAQFPVRWFPPVIRFDPLDQPARVERAYARITDMLGA